MERIAARIMKVLGSYGLVVTILLLLMVLTFLGTIEQADHSLYDVQRKYFNSLIVFGDGVPIPLPGASLLLGLLFVNLMVGGIARLRRSWSRAGILTIHLGIALLLVGGLVEAVSSTKGHMTLFEGESADEFRSYYEWEVTIAERLEAGRERVWVIPHPDFANLGPGEQARFTAPELPFDLILGGYLENCAPGPVADAGAGVDGFAFLHLDRAKEAERNVAGLTVAVDGPDGPPIEGLLWGRQSSPWVPEIGERYWEIDLHKRTWQLPFRVTLDEFTRELHPRTGMASYFSSDVVRSEGSIRSKVHISMNNPMRHHGYTFYQSGWGPQNAGPGARLFSTFSVVENKADRIPLYACIIIAVGLLWHFQTKLRRYIRTEATKRS